MNYRTFIVRVFFIAMLTGLFAGCASMHPGLNVCPKHPSRPVTLESHRMYNDAKGEYTVTSYSCEICPNFIKATNYWK